MKHPEKSQNAVGTGASMVRFLVLVSSLFCLLSFSASAQANEVFNPTADTFVASGFPNESRASVNSIWVGTDPNFGYGIQESLLKFSVSSPGIDTFVDLNARLELYLGGTTTNDAPLDIEAVLITDSWDETITWNGRQILRINEDAKSLPVAVGSNSALEQPVIFDLTPLVTGWLANPEPADSIGILLRPAEEITTQRERAFWSKDCGNKCDPSKHPKLTLTYKTLDVDVKLESQPASQPAYLEDIRFTVTIANTGDVPLPNTQVVVTKPDNAEWPENPTQFIAPFVEPGESELTWTVDLGINETRKFRYALRPKQAEGSSQGTLQSAPVLVRGIYSGSTGDVPFEFPSNDLPPLEYINLGIDTNFTSAPAVVVTDTMRLTYTLIMTNLSDADLDSWTVHATAPSGTRLTEELGGTIPKPTTTVTTTGDITWTVTITRGEAVNIQYSPAITSPSVLIEHSPVVITGFYKPADEVTESKQYTFTTNSVVNLVKFGDAQHIYLPRASKPQ